MKKVLSKLEFNYKKAGFVLVMTCFILPIAVYCIFIALNYSQMYAIHTKVRRALLDAAVAVAREIHVNADNSAESAEHTRLLILAENAFIDGLDVSLGGGGSVASEVPQFTLTLRDLKTKNYSRYSVSAKEGEPTFFADQVKTNVASIFANSFHSKDIYDFEIVDLYCDVDKATGTQVAKIGEWEVGKGPGYCRKKDGDDHNFDCGEKFDIFKNEITWKCGLKVNLRSSKNESKDIFIKRNIGSSNVVGNFNVSGPVFVKNSLVMGGQRYPGDRTIKLGHGATTKLRGKGANDEKFTLSISGDRILTSCKYTFVKTDVTGAVKETVTSRRIIKVGGGTNRRVDLAIAVPLHEIEQEKLPEEPDDPENAKKKESVKDKIAKFIKRINVGNVHVGIVPYSSSVVAPENFPTSSVKWYNKDSFGKLVKDPGSDDPLSHPGIIVKDLYHSIGRNDGRKENFEAIDVLYPSINFSEMPKIQKLMYPIENGTDNKYYAEKDISSEISDTTFLALNNNPCIGTHGNATAIGGWFRKSLDKDNYPAESLFCDTVPEMLETHSYAIKLLTSSKNVIDAALYVSLLTNTREKSNFNYLGLVWAARLINSRNRNSLYSGITDNELLPNDNATKVIVLIATKPDTFAPDEMTHLGLSNDYGDDALNCRIIDGVTSCHQYGWAGNEALGDADSVAALKFRMNDAYNRIKEEIPNCKIYLISFGAGYISEAVPYERCGGSLDKLEAYLNGVADDILSNTGGSITIVE